MKAFVHLSKLACLLFIGLAFIVSCKKNPASPNPPGNNGNATDADTISNHLVFSGATKKQGIAPKGGAGGSLKISFKDTLYLMDKLQRPVKFLQTDTTQNVAGVFIQVMGLNGGPLSTYYYDVPEVKDSSDTVSVVMVGFDPAGITPPLDFNVTITPYNSSGQPITEITRPVKIVEHNNNAHKPGSCGLVLPSGEWWTWVYTWRSDGGFESFPEKVWQSGGQTIKGSCCNGYSVYGICPGTKDPNASLHFGTYYQIAIETLQFFDDGTFFRQTIEDSPIPLPDSSNFCSGGEGVIKSGMHQTTYSGTYSVAAATLPPSAGSWKDSLKVILNTTTTTPKGSGYGNGGGIIHQLDCKVNSLVLWQVDPEGFGQDLFKYERKSFVDSKWYPMF
jgi:hypothetical protein